MILGLRIVAALVIFFTVTIGILLGISISEMRNLGSIESINQTQAALPTRLLDRNGRLITQFFSDEKRELISIEELPKALIYAILSREDKEFFSHNGFSITGIGRAAIGILTNNYQGGGSTITQQLAGLIFADRSDFSLRRKLIELWYAFQLERKWTKNEILQEYLNYSYFGHGTYGVEAASKLYFGHSARDLTLAESAILVIQLASPGGRYSPILNPNTAQGLQRTVLNEMVTNGFATQEEVDQSFEEYWANYDYSRSNRPSAYLQRDDQAPYFSDYVFQTLQNEILLGSYDIYRDGFTVYTTLDLDFQREAESRLYSGLSSANAIYENNVAQRSSYAAEIFAPTVDALSLAFNIPQLRVAGQKQLQLAKQYFLQMLNPGLNALLYQFQPTAQDPLRRSSLTALLDSQGKSDTTTVEGALITLQNDTGHIVAMVGGSPFDPETNSFNRATRARKQPGSSFKPLYYAAAIETEAITPATMIYDSPVVFWNDDGTPYRPENYRGEWVGPVLARTALARSMNVPSIRILSRLGFDAAIDYSSRMLGIPERELIQRNFARSYPLGLGIISTSPIEMAKAFAVFPNQGREVVPIAIQYVEDRFGRVIAEPEKEIRLAQSRKGQAAQIISPQTAYIMTDILQDTVEYGTLRYPRTLVGDFDLPTAGKTGTTQNWTNAWTLGFTPYYTTAIWIGFDSGNQSLGVNQTGAITSGPIWARYMKAIHEGLPWRDFVKPGSGITEMEVTSANGLIPPAGYTGSTYTEVFRTGTQPTAFDFSQEYQAEQQEAVVTQLQSKLIGGSAGTSPLVTYTSTSGSTLIGTVDVSLTLDPELDRLLDDITTGTVTSGDDSAGNTESSQSTPGSSDDPTMFDGNPLLNDDTSGSILGNPYLD